MDKSQRPQRALIVRASRSESGKVRVSLDDALQSGKDEWKFDVHVTANEFDLEDFNSLELNEKVLADFGHYVLARLKTYKNHL
jgi:hypothetical protein